MTKTVTIIGGCGHVGIPLGLTLAECTQNVYLLDVNQKAVDTINAGKLPFLEEDADAILIKAIGKNLNATTDPKVLLKSHVVVFVTGTPVDEHHNPRVHDVLKVIQFYQEYLNPKQLIVLRSTVYPGVNEIIHNLLSKKMGSCKLAFCPERILQGKGIEEIYQLPQIVSGSSEEAENEASDLFGLIAPKILKLKPIEAEIAKLMTNTWRYLEFAIANQFYMMTESQGLDFYKIYGALKEDYPRAKHFAKPGLAAGPCLFKDTMQLSAFHKNNFFMGQSAMLVNEGLPVFLADQLEKKMDGLKNKKVAILGMTFKANNDDIRESLAFKLKKVLEMKMADVICSDEFLGNTTPLNQALETAEGFILGVPHEKYLSLKINRPFVDCWGVWK
ncbi:MAG: nucleotide sugar dehydrogenase [Deltaproteobacteria bacterium]|nr:nucleotide sugar dehydrogenase [Deltaproteobacteria bacterium]